MANWKKIKQQRENGEIVDMQAPEIISASRSTDIPAFYADWFFYRLQKGYSAWINPFNGVKYYISYRNTRFIVFWSKNPRPLLKYIDILEEKGIKCYIQYSLNDYEKEGLEKNVRPLAERIETFKLLVDRLGFGGVIWRFDPLVLTDDINEDDLLNKIENIGNQLKGYTEKLVFSFADISIYKKVQSNLEKNKIPYHEWTKLQMQQFAEKLVLLNKDKGWNYELATCGESIDLQGIEHNHCVDDELIIKRAYNDKSLMTFLKAEIHPIPLPDIFGTQTPLPSNAIILNNGNYAIRGDNRDKGQREFCGCMKSKDIGSYNTCPHMCEYCYANSNKEKALENWKKHNINKYNETII